MKYFKITILIFIFTQALSCSSTPDKKTILDVADFFLNETNTKKLIDIKAKYETQVKGLAFLDKVVQEPYFTPITTELKAVGKVAKALNIEIEPTIEITSSIEDQVEDIIEDVEANWLNQYGWLRLNPKDAENAYDNENPTLFTSEYFWLLKRLGALEGEFKEKSKEKIKQQVALMQLQAGLYDRYPTSLRKADVRTFSHDEQLGLIVLDWLFDWELGYAKDQNNYGIKYDYLYFNAGWSALDTFNRPLVSGENGPRSKTEELARSQRFGAFVEIIRRSAGIPATPAGDFFICAGLLTSLNHNCDHSSDIMMNYLQASLFKDQTMELNGCILQYKYFLSQKFKKGNTCGGKPVTCDNTLCAASEIFFQNENHPIRKLTKLLPDGAL